MIHKHQSLLSDRYVPIRNIPSKDHHCSFSIDSAGKSAKQKSSYSQLICQEQKRCLSFSKKTSSTHAPSQKDHTISTHIRSIREKKINMNFVKKIQSHQIIIAPNVVDNYYGQPLDWSSKGLICVGLQDACYLKHNQWIKKISFEKINPLCRQFTSVKFNSEGSLLYTGCSNGGLNVIDLQKLVPIRYIKSHLNRIGCIQNTFQWGLLTGSKDRAIIHHDIRRKDSMIMKLLAHDQQVCGISIQNNNVASGGNDGKVLIWSLLNETFVHSQKLHYGAVKALSWCPWKINLLASGGGTRDHRIVLLNGQNGDIQHVVQAKSQITSLSWRSQCKDLITSHGGSRYGSTAMIWNSKIKDFTHILTGHEKRINGLKVNPLNSNQICTLSADQTMRFWKIKNETQSLHQKQQLGDLFGHVVK